MLVELDSSIYWHGRLMVLTWAALFPISILAARFFKVTPKQNFPTECDNQIWWWIHQLLQYFGGALIIVALYLLIINASTTSLQAEYHRVLGWLTVSLCMVQFISGWLRGNKGGPTDPRPDGSLFGHHYCMTPRRRLFEIVHKGNGYIALLLSISSILTGLHSVQAPAWMFVSLISWWLILIACFITLQLLGKHIDTYTAIWGHPYTQQSHNTQTQSCDGV